MMKRQCLLLLTDCHQMWRKHVGHCSSHIVLERKTIHLLLIWHPYCKYRLHLVELMLGQGNPIEFGKCLHWRVKRLLSNYKMKRISLASTDADIVRKLLRRTASPRAWIIGIYEICVVVSGCACTSLLVWKFIQIEYRRNYLCRHSLTNTTNSLTRQRCTWTRCYSTSISTFASQYTCTS